MGFEFSDKDVEIISQILMKKPDKFDNSWTWNLADPDGIRPLIVSIYNSVDLDSSSKGSLISVQSRHGYYELHDCRYILPFEPDEVIFLAKNDKKLSCLVIGRHSTCSLFSNIDRTLLNRDFSELDSAVLLSAMQLSITDSLIDP